MSLDELLDGIAQLETSELEQFITQALAVRARRIAPGLRQDETRLLQKINRGLPANAQQRYDDLTAKRRAGTLTFEEHQELLSLIDRIEQADAERVQTMTKLAQLRLVSVTTLMAELDIHPPAYA